MTKYEVANREAKANKLAKVLAEDPRVANHRQILDAPEDFRLLTASVAGTRKPSPQTWCRAVELAQQIVRNRTGAQRVA